MKAVVVTGRVVKIVYHDEGRVVLGVERVPPSKPLQPLSKDESPYMQIYMSEVDAAGIPFGARCKITLELL
jgi:hypothetical protein